MVSKNPLLHLKEDMGVVDLFAKVFSTTVYVKLFLDSI